MGKELKTKICVWVGNVCLGLMIMEPRSITMVSLRAQSQWMQTHVHARTHTLKHTYQSIAYNYK